MKGNPELYFLHYYLQKGFTLDYLLNLTTQEKLFLSASMKLAFEEKAEEWKQGHLVYFGK